MPSRGIVDASPLILLAKVSRLELLRVDGSSVVIPEAVFAEVSVKGHEDVTVRAIRQAAWLEIVPHAEIPEIIGESGLGRGESAVLGHNPQRFR